MPFHIDPDDEVEVYTKAEVDGLISGVGGGGDGTGPAGTSPTDAPRVRVWNGTAYVTPTTAATIYVGGNTPTGSTIRNNDLWVR